MLPQVQAAEVAPDAFLLDDREQDDFDAGHAPHAHHLPMYEVPARLAEVPTDRDVVVVCRVGSRSAQVVGFLLAQGYTRASNLGGGMFAWEAAGRGLVGTAGGAGHVL